MNSLSINTLMLSEFVRYQYINTLHFIMQVYKRKTGHRKQVTTYQYDFLSLCIKNVGIYKIPIGKALNANNLLNFWPPYLSMFTSDCIILAQLFMYVYVIKFSFKVGLSKSNIIIYIHEMNYNTTFRVRLKRF